MFTGIISHVLPLNFINSTTISIKNVFDSVSIGDSISINGVCLTVEKINNNFLFFHCGSVTQKITNLTESSSVNLEQSLRMKDFIGGHFVTGHVDTKVKFLHKQKFDSSFMMYFSMPIEEFAIVQKGSISLNGISLTIVGKELDTFYVQVIPHTYSNTNLSKLTSGDFVNVEYDIFAKYIRGISENKRNTGLF